jgi:hypothetical protein
MGGKETEILQEKLRLFHQRTLRLFEGARILQEEAGSIHDISEGTEKLRQAMKKQGEAIAESRKSMELQKELLRVQEEKLSKN